MPDRGNPLRGFVYTKQGGKLIIKPTGRFPILDMCSPALVYKYRTKYSWTCNAWVPLRDICGYPGTCYISDVHYVWTFALHSSLRLNITFDTILFSSPNCGQANVTVFSSDKFLFCGHVSSLQLFLSESRAQMILHVLTDVHFKLNALFSVIDPNMIHTFSTHKAKTIRKVTKIEELYKQRRLTIDKDIVVGLKRNFWIYIFFIKVRKAFSVLIAAAASWLPLTVFDGPDTTCNVSEKRQNVYISSTFQCTVKKETTGQFTPSKKLDFVSKLINVMLSVGIHQIQAITLPRHICSEQVCAVHIWTEPAFQVNTTVTRLTHEGEKSITCSYGGFVVAENLVGDYKESATLCEPQEGSSKYNRNFYSFNSSVLAILYWYKHHCNMSVTINISQTRCKPVQFDHCFFDAFCTLENGYFMMTCHKYLKKVAQLSDLLFRAHERLQRNSKYSRPHTLSFSFEKDSCTVLQFVSSNGNSYLEGKSHVCKTDIVPSKLFFNAGKAIQYDIVGTFPKYLTDKHQYTAFVNCIQFSGVAQKFCNETGCQTNKPIRSGPKCNMGYFTYSMKIQFLQNTFTIHLSQLQHSLTWLDIVTKQEEAQQITCSHNGSRDAELPFPCKKFNLHRYENKHFRELQYTVGQKDILLYLRQSENRDTTAENQVFLHVNITQHKPWEVDHLFACRIKLRLSLSSVVSFFAPFGLWRFCRIVFCVFVTAS